jgi:hypothetical protein
MATRSTFFKPVLKRFAALKNLLVKSPRSLRGEELRAWINARPEIAEGAKQGFKDIREGRFRKVSRRSDQS